LPDKIEIPNDDDDKDTVINIDDLSLKLECPSNMKEKNGKIRDDRDLKYSRC